MILSICPVWANGAIRGNDMARPMTIEELLGTGEVNRGNVHRFIKRQIKHRRVHKIAEFFSMIARHQDRSLNKLVDGIERLPEWTDFVLDMREEASFRKLEETNYLPAVRFEVSYPRRLFPGQEATMMAHVYAPAFFAHHVGKNPKRMTIKPKIQGVEFCPKSRTFAWNQDSRKVSFQMKIYSRQPHFKLDRPRPGRISFFMESVAVGEAGLQIFLASGEGENELLRRPAKLIADPYKGVFASYAVEDRTEVENMIEAVDDVLGLDYIYTGKARRGKNWREELGEMFKRSDIFQLFWTPNAQTSEKVKREWSQALQCKKNCLIRPVYWIKPLRHYAPPRELRRLPFTYMDM